MGRQWSMHLTAAVPSSLAWQNEACNGAPIHWVLQTNLRAGLSAYAAHMWNKTSFQQPDCSFCLNRATLNPLLQNTITVKDESKCHATASMSQCLTFECRSTYANSNQNPDRGAESIWCDDEWRACRASLCPADRALPAAFWSGARDDSSDARHSFLAPSRLLWALLLKTPLMGPWFI